MNRKDAEDTPSSHELSDFSIRLRTARGKIVEGTAVGSQEYSGLGLSWRVSLELIFAIAVGGCLGWFLDRVFGTLPFFMVVLLVLGGVTGTLNVYRISQGLDESVGLGQAKRRREKRIAEGPP